MKVGIKVFSKFLALFLFLSLVAFPLNSAESSDRTSVMHLTIGSSTLDLNGVPRGMDVAPFIENSRTWVPVRFVAETWRPQFTGARRNRRSPSSSWIKPSP